MGKRMLKKGLFVEKHFDFQSGSGDVKFKLFEKDPVTGKDACRLIYPKQTKDVTQIVANAHSVTTTADLKDKLKVQQIANDRRRVQQLGDLLDKMFVLDPEKRINVSQALSHPFFKDIIPKDKRTHDVQL